MSTRRSRSRQAGAPRITDEQINDLMSKLQAILPEARLGGNDRVGAREATQGSWTRELGDRLKSVALWILQVSAAKVLQEACSYIRSLHKEMDDLSERLSELLSTTEMSSAQAAVVRSLLMWRSLHFVN